MDDQQWLRHLLPLPREIAIADRVELAPSDLGIRIAGDAGPVAAQAAADLRQLFADTADCTPDGNRFTLTLTLADGPVDT